MWAAIKKINPIPDRLSICNTAVPVSNLKPKGIRLEISILDGRRNCRELGGSVNLEKSLSGSEEWQLVC